MMQTQSGFSLIEIVVTLTIMGLIMMVALPLTQSWVNSSNVTETEALLQQAYGRTRGLALANQTGNTTGEAAAYMCVANSRIYVQSASLAGCGASGYSWAGDIKASATITTSASAAFFCMGLNNLGIPVAFSLSGANCTTEKLLTVTKGTESNAKRLY